MTGALLVLVIAIMLGLFTGLQRTAARETARSQTVDLVRVAVDRMTKDIRQATLIHPGSSITTLDMDTYIDGTTSRVIYDASSGTELTRSLNGNTVTLLERMTISAVFGYEPDLTDPSVITVVVTAKPESFSQDAAEVSLRSEVRLRNR